MIKKLSKEVINQIAAGEVIQRPYNVIKELVENSIDAGATQVRITIENGGLTSIEITDNGRGIKKEDFPLLCERFATSKIAGISDLQTIQSFGFRGQALASLSYVSQLQISSRHSEQTIGYRCKFSNQKMVGDPQPFPINSGTKIMAKELFGNLETRRASLNPAQEKKRIIRLVSHFALHYSAVKLSVETEKGTQFESSSRGLSVSGSKLKVFQVITKLSFDKFSYLGREVVDEVRVEGVLTKLNTIKGKTLLLNVNNRIIENPQISRMVERAYSECYQSIHQDNQGFFVYLSLQIDPRKIDCNQHPAKKTIAFFGADNISQAIYRWVLQHVREETSIKNIATNIPSKGSSPFQTSQNMLLNFPQRHNAKQSQGEMKAQSVAHEPRIKDKPVYDFQKNRTDSRQMPINFYMNSRGEGANSKNAELRYNFRGGEKDSSSQNVRKFFQCASYVGCFNLGHIFIHIDNRLYLMNIQPCLQSFVRQWLKSNALLIHCISDQEDWLNLRTIISTFLHRHKMEGRINIDGIITQILTNKDQLAKEYGISIDQRDKLEGVITAFPLLEHFMTHNFNQDQLAYFLCRLFNKNPTLTDTQQYFIQYLVSQFGDQRRDNEEQEMQLSPFNEVYSEYFRDKVVPLLKTKGRDYKDLEFTTYLTQMVNMRDVYKIFERC